MLDRTDVHRRGGAAEPAAPSTLDGSHSDAGRRHPPAAVGVMVRCGRDDLERAFNLLDKEHASSSMPATSESCSPSGRTPEQAELDAWFAAMTRLPARASEFSRLIRVARSTRATALHAHVESSTTVARRLASASIRCRAPLTSRATARGAWLTPTARRVWCTGARVDAALFDAATEQIRGVYGFDRDGEGTLDAEEFRGCCLS